MITEKSTQVGVHLYTKAMLIRSVEQRLLELFKEGRLFGTVHTCIGQEWTGVAIAESLKDGDLVFSNHRCHGHYLAKTGDVEGLIGEIMGKQNGMCGGRGGSQHICSQGFYSNGIQGGIVPVAAGLAMAQKVQELGSFRLCLLEMERWVKERSTNLSILPRCGSYPYWWSWKTITMPRAPHSVRLWQGVFSHAVKRLG